VLASDTTRRYSSLLEPYVLVLVIAFVVVSAALVAAAIGFRARPGRRPRPARPHHLVTAVYVAVLAAVAAGLAVMSVRSADGVAATSRPALALDVVASQWRWTFIYPDGRRARDLVVPVGREVQFRLRSQDVLHGMYIPAVRFKRYAYPDRTNVFELRFDRTGSFLGECSQFCGWNHAYMRFTVRVLSARAYAAWVAGGRA
jgi:cytochrome c oxidase subunit II